MDEKSSFGQLNVTKLTSASNSLLSQDEFEPEALTETTDRSLKRLKRDPFWDELTVTKGKRHCKYCNSSYSMDTGLSTIKKAFQASSSG